MNAVRKRTGSVVVLMALLGIMLVTAPDSVQERETVATLEENHMEILPERQPIVTMKYGEETFQAKYSDQVIDVAYTDDLSLLEETDWTDHHYACRDGIVYYRQQTDKEYEVDESGRAELLTDGEKVMVSVDQEGETTELFTDRGWGDFYLIGERFYMTECRTSGFDKEYRIYSVDMEGNDRIDYGLGEIKTVDEKRDILILEMQEDEDGLVSDYRVLDCDSGACTSLGLLPEEGGAEDARGRWSFEAYQDGWVYLSCFKWNGTKEDAQETELYAVSVEGIWQKVITLTSEEDLYAERIIQLEALEDRLFFTYGGYYGNGGYLYFQGGSIITVKRDGTDYRAIQSIAADKPTDEDRFYLSQSKGRTLVYYAADCYVAAKQDEDEDTCYYVTAWDIDAGTLYPSTFPAYPVCNGKKGIYIDTNNNVYALPDRTGRIVKVTGPLEEYIKIPEERNGEKSIPRFAEVYYTNGYLHFATEYDADSEAYKRGMGTSYYRLKPGEDQAEYLYGTFNREREDRYWREYRMKQVEIENDGETAPAKYCDEVIGAEYTDDLSLLEELDKTDHHYAYRDGKVYYRQYHEDSFNEVGFWAMYDPVPDTEKEMVCIDQEGVKTELFKDGGWGDFYLIGDRFYMTELVETDSGRERRIYSVDGNGRNRIDYGEGKILAVDEKRNSILLEMYVDESGSSHEYCMLECDSGACTSLGLLLGEYYSEEGYGYWNFEAYQDGWIYMSYVRKDTTKEDARETILYAVSPEGEWNEVITLTSDRSYSEYIYQLEAVGDRLFFIFGGYDGSAVVYQGGSIITVKRDGTDGRLIRDADSYERYPSDHYYLQQTEGKTLVYYSCSYYVWPDDGEEEYYWVTAWDIDTGTLYPSEFPAQSIGAGYACGLYVDEENNVLALPDRTGRIVKVTGPLENYIEVLPIDSGSMKDNPQFKELYYKDGYLYFKAEYNEWSSEESMGSWDRYLRVRTEYYRLKLGEEQAELLYFY